MQTHVKPSGLIEYGLGDWCQTNQHHEWVYTTPGELTDTLTGMKICSQARYLFNEIGALEQMEYASKMYDQFRTAFRTAYLQDDLFVNAKTQTAQAMALSVGVFDQSEYAQGFERLIELIRDKNEHFDCGVLGIRVIFHVLAENGYQDLAYKLITQDTYPSYGYLLKKGATTLWEHFTEFKEDCTDYVRKDGNLVVSLNHHFFGDISAWFYKKLAGINVEKGKEVTVCPYPVKSVNKVKADYKNMHGYIKVSLLNDGKETIFKVESDGFNVKVKSPKGYKLEKKNSNEYALLPC
jgi:alpha-L-rhamnosidase